MCAGRVSVNIFVIIKLLRAAVLVFYVFNDRKRNVGLKRNKLTVKVVEGEYVLAFEKVLVLDV